MESTTLSVLTVLSILLAPVIALRVSARLDQRREIRNRRLDVFRTLMTLRANQSNEAYVNALNRIDVEFYSKDKKSKAVVEQWKLLLSHLNDPTYHNENQRIEETKLDQWGQKLREHELDLLLSMAGSLDYEFDKSTLKTTSYYPVGLGDLRTEHEHIRKALIRFLDGKVAIPIIVRADSHTNKIQEG